MKNNKGSLKETAKYLKIGKSTLYKVARERKIPAVKSNYEEKIYGDERNYP